jgi:uncharacterized protein (DUF2267 family)
MDHDSFIGSVQNRAELASRGEALGASRATLETLGERLQEGQATNLAAQLPGELGCHLSETADTTESFDFQTFVSRVAERDENVGNGDDRSEATLHARVVVGVLDEAVTENQLDDVRNQLSPEYDDLFELVDSEDHPGQS